MVEYAVLASTIALLSGSLSGLQESIAAQLLTVDVTASQQAVVAARAAGLPATGAQRAYGRAPYQLPALRYVYVSGWISGAKHHVACVRGRGNPRLVRSGASASFAPGTAAGRRLRRIHVTRLQAAAAFARGFLSACGG